MNITLLISIVLTAHFWWAAVDFPWRLLLEPPQPMDVFKAFEFLITIVL